MTHEDLRRLWQAMRRQPNRFPISRDYKLMRLMVLVVQEIEERLERYSLSTPDRQPSPADSISDGLLGVYCWVQASMMHMQTIAEREADPAEKRR